MLEVIQWPESISGGQAIPVPDGLGLLVDRHAWAEDPPREIAVNAREPKR